MKLRLLPGRAWVFIFACVSVALFTYSQVTFSQSEPPGHAEHARHDEPDEHDEHDEHESSEGIKLTQAQLNLAKIVVQPLIPSIKQVQFYAPGEVQANGYKSYFVSPRVDSVIISRHVTLGQQVKLGQKLVTLFSEDVAEAQGDYRIAYSESQRLKRLGKVNVSAKRLLEAQTKVDAALGRLVAYGLSSDAIRSIATHQKTLLGEYTLDAKQAGSILADDFHQGQRIDAGNTIIILANEDLLWVEARLPPKTHLTLPPGTEAELIIGSSSYTAKVIQEAHTIDAVTRTRIIRLEVKNNQDRLHPGMFGEVNFLLATDKPIMAVPESALIRTADGDWAVFVENANQTFSSIEVTLGRSFGRSTHLAREVMGLDPGTRVVVQGAFFVASEAAKNSFDPHNH